MILLNDRRILLPGLSLSISQSLDGGNPFFYLRLSNHSKPETVWIDILNKRESMVTGFIRDPKIFGPRLFPVWATPFFFRKCSSSRGHSLLHQGPWNDLKWERGAKIGRRVKLGSGVCCPEIYSIYASFKSKNMASLEAIVMFILY